MQTSVKSIVKYTGIAFVFVAPLALVGLAITAVRCDGDSKSGLAKMKALNVVKACRAYQAINDKYPSNLSDLIGTDGNRALLDGGEQAILDPWGKPYKYALVQIENGDFEPY